VKVSEKSRKTGAFLKRGRSPCVLAFWVPD
jgi:hypothetical protein